MNLLIISTGGTINKLYNELTGELEIGKSVAQNISSLARSNLESRELSIINKDSLEMTDEDRAFLAQTVKDSVEENIIILHGTDTMDKSAAVIAQNVQDKKVIFVGSMKPYSIEKDEAIFNFACAVGFLRSNPANGVYISMHSLVSPHDEIYKDRNIGVFKPLNNAFKPTSHENLRKLINRLIEEKGVNADLNEIDTSLITDMSYLFHNSDF